MARELGTLSDEWIGHWVVLRNGNLGVVGANPEAEKTPQYPYLVGTKLIDRVTVTGRWRNLDSDDDDLRRLDIDWGDTAHVVDRLLSALAAEVPEHARLLGPLADRLQEDGLEFSDETWSRINRVDTASKP